MGVGAGLGKEGRKMKKKKRGEFDEMNWNINKDGTPSEIETLMFGLLCFSCFFCGRLFILFCLFCFFDLFFPFGLIVFLIYFLFMYIFFYHSSLSPA
jgi:hypothetical protein